jgi:exosortase A-associated hydrolase 1
MEETVHFQARGKSLFGILHLPDGQSEPSACLVMVVGGPQTRVGSHRSYTLLARDLCRRGIPVLRFDYVGIGDSEGDFVGFAHAGPSVEAAVEFLHGRLPSLRKTILWSLCDGSAACALFAPAFRRRVAGMIICNPYVYSKEGHAKSLLRYYYFRRLLDGAFWRKLFSLRFNPLAAVASFITLVRSAGSGASRAGSGPEAAPPTAAAIGAAGEAEPIAGRAPPPGLVGPGEDPPNLPEKVMDGLESFPGRLFLILSTDDYSAKEFLSLYRKRPALHARAELRYVDGADHTFTTGEWKREVCRITEEAWKSVL